MKALLRKGAVLPTLSSISLRVSYWPRHSTVTPNSGATNTQVEGCTCSSDGPLRALARPAQLLFKPEKSPMRKYRQQWRRRLRLCKHGSSSSKHDRAARSGAEGLPGAGTTNRAAAGALATASEAAPNAAALTAQVLTPPQQLRERSSEREACPTELLRTQIGLAERKPSHKDAVWDSKFFTPEVRFDTSYVTDFNHPKDDTIGGSTEISGRTRSKWIKSALAVTFMAKSAAGY